MIFFLYFFKINFCYFFPVCSSESVHSFYVNVDWYTMKKCENIEQIEWWWQCFSIDSFCFLTQWLYCSCQKTVEKNHPLSAFPCEDWTKTEKKNSESSEWTIAVCHCATANATAFITNCSIFFLSTSYGWLYCIIKSSWSASSIMCVAILSRPWN